MADSLVTIAEMALDSEFCHCTRRKRRNDFFCVACYRRLPGRLKGALVRSGREARADGYDACKDWLREND